MSAPIPLAPYPPPPIRASIPQSEWSAILDTWNAAVTHLLQLPTVKFTAALANSKNNVIPFLRSYLTSSPPSAAEPDSRAFKTLHKNTFLLLHRTLTIPKPPPQLLSPDLLLGFARLYSRVPAAQKLLDELWKTHEPQLEAAVTTLKRFNVYHEAPLAKLFSLSPKAAAMFLAGDEFTDSMVEAGDEISAKVFARALVKAPRMNWSVVIDNIYSLCSSAGEKEKAFLLILAKLGIGEKLLALAKGTEYEARVSTAVRKLQTFVTASRESREGKTKAVDKGKSPAYAGGGEEAEMAEMAEMASKVDLVRDMFPSLGIGFVRQCLQSMGGDVEAVTGALLEDNLPADLEGVSRDEESVSPEAPPHRPTPPPAPASERRNIFDNDDFDRLAPSTIGKLTQGRRADSATADALLKQPVLNKSHILSALAAFDLDEDERDDTYDAADVGGAVDATAGDETTPDAESRLQRAAGGSGEDEEKKVWSAYQRSPGAFARKARGGKERKQLTEETGWTDEMLEGWAVMLEREPERRRRLERGYADQDMYGGQQQVVLERTSWRGGDEESEPGRGKGRGRGRGRARGFRGSHGGAAASGSGSGGGAGASGGDTARGRARKEQHKGRVANHNRRDARDRKMARGFAGGPPS